MKNLPGLWTAISAAYTKIKDKINNYQDTKQC
jgi:hypothetical protein